MKSAILSTTPLAGEALLQLLTEHYPGEALLQVADTIMDSLRWDNANICRVGLTSCSFDAEALLCLGQHELHKGSGTLC